MLMPPCRYAYAATLDCFSPPLRQHADDDIDDFCASIFADADAAAFLISPFRHAADDAFRFFI